MEAHFQQVTEWLLFGGIDFDFLCESLLPELCPKGGAPLKVGEMTYDAVIVPGCETLRSTTLERLEAFRQAGGRLIFLAEAPTLENGQLFPGAEKHCGNEAYMWPWSERCCWMPCPHCVRWNFGMLPADR